MEKSFFFSFAVSNSISFDNLLSFLWQFFARPNFVTVSCWISLSLSFSKCRSNMRNGKWTQSHHVICNWHANEHRKESKCSFFTSKKKRKKSFLQSWNEKENFDSIILWGVWKCLERFPRLSIIRLYLFIRTENDIIYTEITEITLK